MYKADLSSNVLVMTLKEELFCKTASPQVTFRHLGPPSAGQGLISATLRRDGCVQWSG